jgi:hypothetical protein
MLKLERLQSLPGFDNEAVIHCAGMTEETNKKTRAVLGRGVWVRFRREL